MFKYTETAAVENRIAGLMSAIKVNGGFFLFWQRHTVVLLLLLGCSSTILDGALGASCSCFRVSSVILEPLDHAGAPQSDVGRFHIIQFNPQQENRGGGEAPLGSV